MSAQGAQAPATLCASQTTDVMAPGPFTRMACQGFHLLRPMPGLPWPALDAATQANLWPTKSAITSMPARDADVMALNSARLDVLPELPANDQRYVPRISGAKSLRDLR